MDYLDVMFLTTTLLRKKWVTSVGAVFFFFFFNNHERDVQAFVHYYRKMIADEGDYGKKLVGWFVGF